MSKIAILLSTYNSVSYLKEQLNSIISQTYTKWELYIHDDRSNDGTIAIINSYVEQDNRIHLMKDNLRRGAAGSFMWLLENTEADFYMFCDHDDIWLPQKIEITLKQMLSYSSKQESTPIIVATDAKVVNAKLDIIHSSFWHYCHTRVKYFSDKYFYLFYNNIPGCCMMFNDAAKKVALPYHEGSFIHDSWVIVSCLFNHGIIIPIHQSQMLYRQHSNNLVGTRESPSLVQQIIAVNSLTKKTYQRYTTARFFVKMGFLPFLFLKVKYLLLFHFERFLDNIHSKSS